MRARSKSLLWGLLLLGSQPGCALTSKAEALSPRYFNPQLAAEPHSRAAAQPFELRLGQVSSASHLDERIPYRISAAEVGFYEDRRWTEIPEAFLRRALERELFEERRLTRVVSGVAPVLDVELTALEEVRGNPNRARVTLTVSLRDERRALLQRSVELERPVSEQAGTDPAQRLALTLAVTLAQAVQTVGGEVVANLSDAGAAAVEKQNASP
jgi:cholesterol transport system auxiliary component